jgi:hypothetical protein
MEFLYPLDGILFVLRNIDSSLLWLADNGIHQPRILGPRIPTKQLNALLLPHNPLSHSIEEYAVHTELIVMTVT